MAEVTHTQRASAAGALRRWVRLGPQCWSTGLLHTRCSSRGPAGWTSCGRTRGRPGQCGRSGTA